MLKVSTRYENNSQLNIAKKKCHIESSIVITEFNKNKNQLIIQSSTVPTDVHQSQSGKSK